ncbi:MAG: dihydrolipoamide acetyltransferase family protein [Actinobacteria bacterium]|nr:dihydrolipoamide acetyltransferase family protein [Actinomycetota bacterium]
MADITLPQLGETVTEGTITRWFKKVGDTIAADEPLFEVSTDKVDTEVPSPVAGTVTEIRVAEGETVAVGTVIAVVGAAGAAPAPAPVAAAPAPVVAPAPAPVAAAPAPVAAPVVAPAPAPVVAAPSQTNKLLSPVVRRLVTEHQIDIDALTGSGPGGRITREDVLDYIDQHGLKAAAQVASAPAPAPVVSTPAPVAAPAPMAAPAPRPTAPTGEREQVVALSKIRKLTGAHMVMSKAVSPHAFSVVEVDYANVDRTRSAVKESWKSGEGFSLTYLPFIARAVVDALADFPHVNSSIDGDNLVVHGYIDLGIAVDLDYQGLLVPVVRSADAKRLRAIAREINDLATRARGRKLSPDEIQGGTFTLSNNGSAGALICMPIINQPQVAILSTDAIVRKPVVVTAQDGSESIAIHPAARFISRVKQIIETQDWSAEL